MSSRRMVLVLVSFNVRSVIDLQTVRRLSMFSGDLAACHRRGKSLSPPATFGVRVFGASSAGCEALLAHQVRVPWIPCVGAVVRFGRS